jgi:hypothetical protein
MKVRSWHRLVATLATAECVLAFVWPGLLAPPVAAAPEAAVGVLPPAHPRHNCVPPGLNTASAASLLASIDYCRAIEHVGSVHLPSNFRDLTAREQLFVLLNLERVNRGEPPVLALTGSLDTSADAGAATGRDPAAPAGPVLNAWYSIDVDYGKPLAADWWWMYDDGYGSGNVDCHAVGGPGCWVHRDNVLAVLHNSIELVGGGGCAPDNCAFLLAYEPHPTGIVFRWSYELRFFASPPTLEPA